MTAPEQPEKTILIVDDEWSIHELLDDLLSDAGYRVAHARDGAEALDYLRGHGDRPSLILLDMMLPDVTGVEFLVQQQADAALAHIPVILLTGNARLIRAGEFLGVTEAVEKPFNTADLVAVVNRLSSSQEQPPNHDVDLGDAQEASV